MKQKIFITTVFLFVWFLQTNAQTPLQSYIDSALKNNPSLKAYNFQSSALQQKINPAKALEDPMIYGGVMNLPVNFSFTQDMMTMEQVGIQQNFSVAKKYSLNNQFAQKDFQASQFDVKSFQLSLINNVTKQYYDLYAQQKNIEATLNSIEAMKQFITIANSKYSTGMGTQQDIFKAELELTKMQNELIKMQSMKQDMTAMFNTLLARDKTDSVVIPSEIKFTAINLAMDSLTNDAAVKNPMLLSTKTMLSQDSISYLLAKASKIPDFNAGVWYGQRQGMTPDGTTALPMIGFSLGMTLPIYAKQKQNPLIASSQIEIQKTQSQIEATQNEIELMVHQALIDAEKNSKLISLYEKQLHPQAEQTLTSGITGYQENKIDFMTLTDNFLSLYEFRQQYNQAVADYMKAIADLEMLTGKTLIIK